MLRGIVRLALIACAIWALCGCGRSSEHVLVVRDWELVTPGGIHERLVLPARVDRWLPSTPSEYRIRARVELPAEMRGQRLTLAFPQLHARAELSANGDRMAGLVPEMYVGWRGTDQPCWRIPATQTRGDGVLDLELVVSYRMVMSAWIDVAPRLSDTEEGDSTFAAVADFNRTQAVTCSIAVLITSFSYAIIYALDRRRVAYGWFALQGLVGGGGYAIVVEGISQRFFGVYETCFVPVFLCTGVVASVEFSHTQFGLPKPSRLWWLGLAVCVALVLAFPSPFVGPRIGPPWSCLMAGVNVAYQVPLSARVWRTRGRPLAALVILLSWAALGLFGLPDLVAWAGFGEILGGARGACWGFFLVAFLQSLVISVEHHRTLGRADELNLELSKRVEALSAKNAEVLHLNDELRRQIGARADALAMALAQATAPRTDGLRELEPGEIVAKRYRVERAVGEGATGRVYEVTRLSDGGRFALKLLDPASDATEMARFAREAQIISQMDHPNVIRIADVDITHEGFFYLIVEFVEGLSLRHHYARARSLAWNVSVLAQVSEGLAAIHARGIVHRDLKPANVLVTSAPDRDEHPRVKIADFGISSTGLERDAPITSPPSAEEMRSLTIESAPLKEPSAEGSIPTGSSRRSVTQTDSLLTQTGAWLGTPKYMAPELGGAAKHARPASDIFAFGVMAYELLVGTGPFEESPAITRVKGEPFVQPRPLRASAGTLDAAVSSLLDRCLAEAPGDRPEAKELATTLSDYSGQLARRGERISRSDVRS
ncbi:MAG: serine/threonine-protein kinase [Polyangiaceae bacterium]